jgi:hypothetical protein
MSKITQHKTIAEGKGGAQPVAKASPRYYGEGGYVRTHNMSHATKGALMGYKSKVSGGCKGG